MNSWPNYLLPFLPLLALFTGCATNSRPPIPTVPQVDLPRFMGDWHVIAHIPIFIEREAHNAVESYTFAPDGTIATTFTFHAGDPDGPLKRYTPRGFVRDQVSNATWGMQFIWPVKAEFLIAYLDGDYTQTIIAQRPGLCLDHGPLTGDSGDGLQPPRGPVADLGLRR